MNIVMNTQKQSQSQSTIIQNTNKSNIDNILMDLEYYMFHKDFYLRLFENNKDIVSSSHFLSPLLNKEINEKVSIDKKSNNISIFQKPQSKEDFFCPKQKDSLFWCFYVMKNGEIEYELLNNNKITFITEKKMKIDFVDLLRKEKNSFKKQSIKFPSLTHIENFLVNESSIDIQTFISLCHFEKLNVLYVYKKTYFEWSPNEGEPVHIIKRVDNKYQYLGTHSFLLEKYRLSFFKIDHIEKPVKAMSAYLLSDLIDISNKLDLAITYHDEKSAKIKNKSKQALYEQIVQSLC